MMKYEIHSHRNAETIFSAVKRYAPEWKELLDSLDSISEDAIIEEFEKQSSGKSISIAINRLIKKELVSRGWTPESPIFMDESYGYGGKETPANQKGKWRLDFAKEYLCAEVAFNHRSDIAWNLLKPTLSSELNHVTKFINTEGGVVICAKEELKASGGFDNAIGTFEDYVHYLLPMQHILSAPIAIIGLEAPEGFYIRVPPQEGRKRGFVERITQVEGTLASENEA